MVSQHIDVSREGESASNAPRASGARNDVGRRGFWTVVLLGTIGVTVGGFFAGYLRRGASSAHYGLSIEEQDLWFGTVWTRNDFPWTVVIHNHTGKDVEIKETQTSCACISVEPKSLVVPARGQSAIQLVLDLTSVNRAEPVAVERTFEVGFTLVTDLTRDLPYLKAWQLCGRVRTALRFSAPVIDFQDRLVEGHSFESREIRILPLVPLAGLDAECNPESGVVAVDHGGEKIQDFKLRVTPNASLPVGMFRFPVHLRAILVGGEVLPPVSIDVIGNVTTDIWALPSAVELHTRTPGQLAEEYVAIQSKSGTEFVVEKIHGQCSEIDVESPPDRYAALHVLRVAARFGVAGTHSRLVTVTVRSRSGKVTIVSIPVSCRVFDDWP